MSSSCLILLVLFILAEYDIISPLITAFNVSQRREGEISSFLFDSIKSSIFGISFCKRCRRSKDFCLISKRGVPICKEEKQDLVIQAHDLI